jgi:membrane-bound lytic murein transglycosylase D
MAITLIAKDPEKYGFSLPENKILDYEEIKVNGGIDLKVFSVAGDIDYDMLLLLNAELRRKITPPHTIYALKIPYGKREILEKNLLSLKTVKKEKDFAKIKIEIVTLPEESKN